MFSVRAEELLELTLELFHSKIVNVNGIIVSIMKVILCYHTCASGAAIALLNINIGLLATNVD